MRPVFTAKSASADVRGFMDETETLGTIVATNEFSAFEMPSASRTKGEPYV